MYDKSEATYTWVEVSSNKQQSMVVLCVCYCVIIVSSWFRSRLSLITIKAPESTTFSNETKDKQEASKEA